MSQSHKFVRLYPLGQYDLGIDQQVIEFQTEDERDLTEDERTFAERTPTDEYFGNIDLPKPNTIVDAVDFTVSLRVKPNNAGYTNTNTIQPPALVSALITETGVLTPSAVSEELISMWY